MSCHHGMNLSFARWTGRLPLLANFVQRGRGFEVFRPDGTPTGEPSPLESDGWPDMTNGRWHGVRVFGDMEGTMPEVEITDPANGGVFGSVPTGGHENARVIQKGRDALFLMWKDVDRRPRVADANAISYAGLHGPSLEYLRSWGPAAVRTLDLQLTNEVADFDLGRVLKRDPLQTTSRGMAVEYQAAIANLCESTLWWPAPARYGLTVPQYEELLEEHLAAIKAVLVHPPAVQCGNELWNDKLGPGAWLKRRALAQGRRVSDAAADEIAILRRVGDRVFGPPRALGQRTWYLFVDGCLADPSYLDRVLGSLPHGSVDAAGPAFYVGPGRDDSKGWEMTNHVPDQAELEASCRRTLRTATDLLLRNVSVARTHGVDYPAVYEAGQAMLAGGAAWRAAAIEAQDKEWLRGLYLDMRAALDATGVTLSCWYSLMTDQRPVDTRVDVFGHVGGLGMAEPPKARGARGL